MTHIIIDGYNVIGIMHRDIEASRNSFIEFLIAYYKKSDNDITVVFDGHKSGSRFEESMIRGGVRVIYSRLNATADDVIKRIITEERRQWIVVSSDRAIVSHAWSTGSIPIDSDLFYQKALTRINTLEHEHSTVDPDDFDEEDNYAEEAHHQKGNPHRLSKKDRLIKRGLSKI
ncbi:MAG: NYN domain-containing protein [Dissulfurispiraceae bacterium]|jgi:predicted RNA-binding protein with PIN domain|nr:NYN domain-containing protein [Dissulfurispiraceae bacterium]